MSSTLAAATSRGSAARASGASPSQPSHPGQPGRGAARPPRPSLRVVAAPPPDRARVAFAGLCLLLLVGGLLTLLLVNTVMAGGSFRLHDLQATSDQLTDRQQALRQDIAVQAAPARLAARAKALGMVPSQSPAFLRLSDGKILGVAQAATVPPTPTVKAQSQSATAKASSGSASGSQTQQKTQPKTQVKSQKKTSTTTKTQPKTPSKARSTGTGTTQDSTRSGVQQQGR